MTRIENYLSSTAQQKLETKKSSTSSSFSEMLENGLSAKQISTQRARSFSEAGILGLHYSQPEKASHLATGTTSLQPQRNTNERPFVNDAFREYLNHSHLTRETPKTNPAILEKHTGKTVSSTLSVKNNEPFLIGQERFSTVINNDESSTDIMQGLAQKIRTYLRSKSLKIRLSLVETQEGVSLVFEDSIFSEEEMREVQQIGKKIAFSAGVYIKKVQFISRNGLNYMFEN